MSKCKIIALAGAVYGIYDGQGSRYIYPEETTLDTFYTGADGYLITPEELPFGDYTMMEVQAPYGYVLDSTPIPFTVAQENSTEESGVTVVVTEQKNMP